MDIVFKNRKLANLFNSESELLRKYGKQKAQLIKRRLMVLNAAPSLEAVPYLRPERRHELSGDRKGTFAVDVGPSDRLIFRPNHSPMPRKEDGGIDLKNVTAIIILGVEDYH